MLQFTSDAHCTSVYGNLEDAKCSGPKKTDSVAVFDMVLDVHKTKQAKRANPSQPASKQASASKARKTGRNR